MSSSDVLWKPRRLNSRAAARITASRRALWLQVFAGWGRHFRGSRIFRAEDGDLHVVGVFEERGWMFFLFPFTDHHEDELVLERLDG